jgi:uncharacterized membrane protein
LRICLRVAVGTLAIAACSNDRPPTLAPSEASLSVVGHRRTSSWTPLDLGSDPAYYASVANAVSDRGDIAGVSYQWLQPPQAFVRRLGEARQYLPALPGDDGAYPIAINNAGLIVGGSQNASLGRWQAVYWNREGRINQISGVISAQLEDVSESGWIVGTTHVGFRWRPGGQPLLLYGDASYPFSRALGVNNAGWVAGESFGPALWSPTGVFQRLPMPTGAINGIANDVNDAGEAVGSYLMSDYTSRAFHWSKRRGVSLLRLPAGMTITSAISIDKRGRIYGYASAGSGSPSSPYVWIDGAPSLLPIPAIPFQYAILDVNTCGTAVGYGFDYNGGHEVLWATTC